MNVVLSLKIQIKPLGSVYSYFTMYKMSFLKSKFKTLRPAHCRTPSNKLSLHISYPFSQPPQRDDTLTRSYIHLIIIRPYYIFMIYVNVTLYLNAFSSVSYIFKISLISCICLIENDQFKKINKFNLYI